MIYIPHQCRRIALPLMCRGDFNLLPSDIPFKDIEEGSRSLHGGGRGVSTCSGFQAPEMPLPPFLRACLASPVPSHPSSADQRLERRQGSIAWLPRGPRSGRLYPLTLTGESISLTRRNGSTEIIGATFTPTQVRAHAFALATFVADNRIRWLFSVLSAAETATCEGWCRLQDSNPRPPLYKSIALPTELNRPWTSAIKAAAGSQHLLALFGRNPAAASGQSAASSCSAADGAMRKQGAGKCISHNMPPGR